MAGIRAMGDLSHEVESFLAAASNSGPLAADARAIDVLQLRSTSCSRMREMAVRASAWLRRWPRWT